MNRKLLTILTIAILLTETSAIFLITPIYSEQTSKALVLVSDNEADLIVAKYFASVISAQMLIVPWGTFPSNIEEEIMQVAPLKVVIIGGVLAVPEEAETFLKEMNIPFIRLGGKDRVETSAEIYKYLVEQVNVTPDQVIILGGYDFVALKQFSEVSNLTNKTVIVYASQQSTVPKEVLDIMKTKPVNNIKVVPSPLLTTSSIESQISSAAAVSAAVESIFEESNSVKASEMIKEAEIAIEEANSTIRSSLSSENVSVALAMLEEAEKLLKEATEIYKNSNYIEAYKLAISARDLASKAKEIIEGINVRQIIKVYTKAITEILKEKIVAINKTIKTNISSANKSTSAVNISKTLASAKKEVEQGKLVEAAKKVYNTSKTTKTETTSQSAKSSSSSQPQSSCKEAEEKMKEAKKLLDEAEKLLSNYFVSPFVMPPGIAELESMLNLSQTYLKIAQDKYSQNNCGLAISYAEKVIDLCNKIKEKLTK